MLDFSLAEFGIVGLVAFILLGREDFLELLRATKLLKNKMKNYFNCYFADYNEIIVNEKVVDFMLDKEGKVQKMYDTKEIADLLKNKTRK
jgi:Sec-independent protein translocase protein TatA